MYSALSGEYPAPRSDQPQQDNNKYSIQYFPRILHVFPPPLRFQKAPDADLSANLISSPDHQTCRRQNGCYFKNCFYHDSFLLCQFSFACCVYYTGEIFVFCFGNVSGLLISSVKPTDTQNICYPKKRGFPGNLSLGNHAFS